MKVGLVLASSTGGIGRHVRDLARAGVDAGHDVVVCGPQPTEDLFRFTSTGASFTASRRAPRGRDVVHAHGLRAAFASDAQVVTWHNAFLGSGGKRALWRVAERRIARRATVSLCVSPDLVAAVRAAGGRDVRLAPVGVALAAPTGTDPGLGHPLVLAVGRLHPQKGYDVLVEAAATWRSRTPPPVVAIAGDGPARASLEGRGVTLLGRRDDVPDLLAAADVVVMPSRWEGSPLAAQEALHSGRPLVASAVGGLPDLVGDGALLVPPEDPAALAAAVSGLLDDPARAAALAAAGRARAATWPTVEESVRRVLAIWAEVG